MYNASRMPLFHAVFTAGFLLRKLIELYSHHTGVLLSRSIVFGHTAAQVAWFFNGSDLKYPINL